MAGKNLFNLYFIHPVFVSDPSLGETCANQQHYRGRP